MDPVTPQTKQFRRLSLSIDAVGGANAKNSRPHTNATASLSHPPSNPRSGGRRTSSISYKVSPMSYESPMYKSPGHPAHGAASPQTSPLMQRGPGSHSGADLYRSGSAPQSSMLHRAGSAPGAGLQRSPSGGHAAMTPRAGPQLPLATTPVPRVDAQVPQSATQSTATPSGSHTATALATTTHTALARIAQQEQVCVDLRAELARQERTLAQLKREYESAVLEEQHRERGQHRSHPSVSSETSSASSLSYKDVAGETAKAAGETVKVAGESMKAASEWLLNRVGPKPSPGLHTLTEEDEAAEAAGRGPPPASKSAAWPSWSAATSSWTKRLSTLSESETFKTSKRATWNIVDSFEKGLTEALGPVDASESSSLQIPDDLAYYAHSPGGSPRLSPLSSNNIPLAPAGLGGVFSSFMHTSKSGGEDTTPKMSSSERFGSEHRASSAERGEASEAA